MEITGVVVRKLTFENRMRAVVSITLDDMFAVHDIKVIEGANGLFVAMPSRKTMEGDYKDIVHPINSEFREKISSVIIEKYKEELAKYRAELDSAGEASPSDSED
ncbi:MAG: septation regulator SpoVG [Clostridiales bacterium]|nr:septation regulator SpoVG [Clostridiales bacterium]MBR4010164.1 septation regulator SpoVG [Clostridiales bacterium]